MTQLSRITSPLDASLAMDLSVGSARGHPLTNLPLRSAESAGVAAASLFADPAVDAMVEATAALSLRIGVPFARHGIPVSLARGGTVGRIGVPQHAVEIMHAHRVLIAATRGGDPLAPVARLFRGLQRRADILVDVRQCMTLPGSAAAAAGNERDVLLLTQRTNDRTVVRARHAFDNTTGHSTRVRQAADLACRIAITETRKLLLVLPVGRGTKAHGDFAEAVERQARGQRLPTPRTVKAGLLSALLSGEGGQERWLVASVIPMDELTAMTVEAMGDTGPWPVIGYGRTASCYDLQEASAATDPLPMLLVLVSLLARAGHGDLSRTLQQAVLTTAAAHARMQEELGMTLQVPVAEFHNGVLANWGRPPIGGPARALRATPTVTGLRLRIETTLTAPALRAVVTRAILSSGLEVASVRGGETLLPAGLLSFDVRIRSRLGEPVLGDEAALALVGTFGGDLRCTAIDPMSQTGLTAERHRSATARVALV